MDATQNLNSVSLSKNPISPGTQERILKARAIADLQKKALGAYIRKQAELRSRPNSAYAQPHFHHETIVTEQLGSLTIKTRPHKSYGIASSGEPNIFKSKG
ncbi:MAG: hypothetical protein WC860_02730 [Candidatus Margulisiibacteriota bacterium]|jgi:hypothetical protein